MQAMIVMPTPIPNLVPTTMSQDSSGVSTSQTTNDSHRRLFIRLLSRSARTPRSPLAAAFICS
jgi:hypothetical protein